MADVCKHFRDLGFVPKTIFDIGVAFGTFELYDAWPEARLLLVDPISEWESTMQYVCSHRRAPASYVVAAAGDHEGEVLLGCTAHLAGASLLGEEGQRSVPMHTLDNLSARWSAEPPYLLKIDVQGAELVVLKGALGLLPHCEVVMLEVPLWDFYETGFAFLEMLNWMASHGFVPFDIYDGLRRPLDRSLAQVDIAFVKSNGQFRQSNSWQTSKQNRRRSLIHKIRQRVGV
jgi:FkbM family methyltransferase